MRIKLLLFLSFVILTAFSHASENFDYLLLRANSDSFLIYADSSEIIIDRNMLISRLPALENEIEPGSRVTFFGSRDFANHMKMLRFGIRGRYGYKTILVSTDKDDTYLDHLTAGFEGRYFDLIDKERSKGDLRPLTRLVMNMHIHKDHSPRISLRTYTDTLVNGKADTALVRRHLFRTDLWHEEWKASYDGKFEKQSEFERMADRAYQYRSHDSPYGYFSHPYQLAEVQEKIEVPDMVRKEKDLCFYSAEIVRLDDGITFFPLIKRSEEGQSIWLVLMDRFYDCLASEKIGTSGDDLTAYLGKEYLEKIRLYSGMLNLGIPDSIPSPQLPYRFEIIFRGETPPEWRPGTTMMTFDSVHNGETRRVEIKVNPVYMPDTKKYHLMKELWEITPGRKFRMVSRKAEEI